MHPPSGSDRFAPRTDRSCGCCALYSRAVSAVSCRARIYVVGYLCFMFRAVVVWVYSTKSLLVHVCATKIHLNAWVSRGSSVQIQYQHTQKLQMRGMTCVKSMVLLRATSASLWFCNASSGFSASASKSALQSAVVAMTPSGPACSFSSTTPCSAFRASLRLSTSSESTPRAQMRLAAARLLVSHRAAALILHLQLGVAGTLWGWWACRTAICSTRAVGSSERTDCLLHGLWRNVWQRCAILWRLFRSKYRPEPARACGKNHSKSAEDDRQAQRERHTESRVEQAHQTMHNINQPHTQTSIKHGGCVHKTR